MTEPDGRALKRRGLWRDRIDDPDQAARVLVIAGLAPIVALALSEAVLFAVAVTAPGGSRLVTSGAIVPLIAPLVPAAGLSAWLVFGRSQIAGGIWLIVTLVILAWAAVQGLVLLAIPLRFGLTASNALQLVKLVALLWGPPLFLWAPAGWLVCRGIFAAPMMRGRPLRQTRTDVVETFT